MARQRGFTLIELMVVVAVIAILAVIAVSSYTEQVHKSRRANAYNEIAQLQLQLERWRAENPCYGTTGAGTCSTFTASGTYIVMPTDTYYSFPSLATFLATTTPTTYSITATPQSGQANDRCGSLVATGNAKPQWNGNSNCN